MREVKVEVGQIWASKVDNSFQIYIESNAGIEYFKVVFPSLDSVLMTEAQINRKYIYIGRSQEEYNNIAELKNYTNEGF